MQPFFALFLLIMVLARPATAGRVEKALHGVFDHVCQLVLVEGTSPRSRDQLTELFHGHLFRLYPHIFYQGSSRLRFQQIVIDRTMDWMNLGLPALFAAESAARVIEHLWERDMTPAELEAAYDHALAASTPLLEAFGHPEGIFDWENLPLRPRNPFLQTTIAIFKKTGLPVRTVSMKPIVEIQRPGFVRSFAGYFHDGTLPFTNDGLYRCEAEGVDICMQAASRYGAYLPNSNPRGILLASYMVHATPAEYVLHEITHAVQDVAWEHLLLVKVVHRELRSFLDAYKAYTKEDPTYESRYQNRRRHYSLTSLEPAYRQGILQAGDELKFGALEWNIFFDLLTLVQEIDAHQQAGMLAHENGRRPEMFESREALFQYVIEAYADHMKVISPLGKNLFQDPDPIFRLVEELNQHRKYRDTWRLWWASARNGGFWGTRPR